MGRRGFWFARRRGGAEVSRWWCAGWTPASFVIPAKAGTHGCGSAWGRARGLVWVVWVSPRCDGLGHNRAGAAWPLLPFRVSRAASCPWVPTFVGMTIGEVGAAKRAVVSAIGEVGAAERAVVIAIREVGIATGAVGMPIGVGRACARASHGPVTRPSRISAPATADATPPRLRASARTRTFPSRLRGFARIISPSFPPTGRPA